MKTLLASAAILAAATGGTLAAGGSVVGDWLVKDGYATIRIDNCAGRMWGIVVWEKVPGGVDEENPDPAKKTRLTLGMPILLGLAPVPKEAGKWQGEIYNSQNGKMYSASISLADEDTLDLEGCLFPNFMCLTQKWTRVKTPPPNMLPLPPIKSSASPAAKQVAAKKGVAPATSEVCLRVADEAAALEKSSAKK
jgi:uncharacterized protein (DUF2147 family)